MSRSNGLDQQGENLMMEQKETLSDMRICVLFYTTICNIAAVFTSPSNDPNLQPQRTKYPNAHYTKPSVSITLHKFNRLLQFVSNWYRFIKCAWSDQLMTLLPFSCCAALLLSCYWAQQTKARSLPSQFSCSLLHFTPLSQPVYIN